MPPLPPLSILPLLTVLRSYAITSLSSSRLLLPPSLAILSVLAHSSNPFLNPDRNPILHRLIKSTFYTHFCAGENAKEVSRTVNHLKRDIGYSGVILGYAREIVLSQSQVDGLAAEFESDNREAVERDCWKTEVEPWFKGTLETVRMAERGDFVALKFTGAGRQSLYLLARNLPPCKPLGNAIAQICELAQSRGVRLLFDAEQTAVQAGIDSWTLDAMRKYNKTSAVVFGTYQSYLKSTPATVAAHLHAASEEGFVLGVKQVRGAYMGSDPRHLIHDTKADTDAAYDGVANALLRQEWTGPLAEFAPMTSSTTNSTPVVPASNKDQMAPFPRVEMVLASHNAETVNAARKVLASGAAKSPVAFGQLQGMADEISCELVTAKNEADAAGNSRASPQPYKYLVWGSTGECMKYLLRRAEENRDAVQRTQSGRDAMQAEIWRRMKGVFGLA